RRLRRLFRWKADGWNQADCVDTSLPESVRHLRKRCRITPGFPRHVNARDAESKSWGHTALCWLRGLSLRPGDPASRAQRRLGATRSTDTAAALRLRDARNRR